MKKHKKTCPCAVCEDDRMANDITRSLLWAILPPYLALLLLPIAVIWFVGWVISVV